MLKSLHEWHYDLKERPKLVLDNNSELVYNTKEPIENLITWVYEEGSFAPSAKIIGEKRYSIINDYIGRPIQAYSSDGNLIWETDYDIYGQLRNLKGDKNFVPFRQLGQYEDVETGLYYNRFRYYSPYTGLYISQDPIGLFGGRAFYAFVHNSNSWVDIFGLLGKTLAEWLKDSPDLLQEARDLYKTSPEWQGIDPDNTEVFYRDKADVDIIRAKAGESGGHHPHGLALGGPEGQKLTITNETRKIKNPDHSKATGFQRKVINKIKCQ